MIPSLKSGVLFFSKWNKNTALKKLKKLKITGDLELFGQHLKKITKMMMMMMKKRDILMNLWEMREWSEIKEEENIEKKESLIIKLLN